MIFRSVLNCRISYTVDWRWIARGKVNSNEEKNSSPMTDHKNSLISCGGFHMAKCAQVLISIDQIHGVLFITQRGPNLSFKYLYFLFGPGWFCLLGVLAKVQISFGSLGGLSTLSHPKMKLLRWLYDYEI